MSRKVIQIVPTEKRVQGCGIWQYAFYLEKCVGWKIWEYDYAELEKYDIIIMHHEYGYEENDIYRQIYNLLSNYENVIVWQHTYAKYEPFISRSRKVLELARKVLASYDDLSVSDEKYECIPFPVRRIVNIEKNIPNNCKIIVVGLASPRIDINAILYLAMNYDFEISLKVALSDLPGWIRYSSARWVNYVKMLLKTHDIKNVNLIVGMLEEEKYLKLMEKNDIVVDFNVISNDMTYFSSSKMQQYSEVNVPVLTVTKKTYNTYPDSWYWYCKPYEVGDYIMENFAGKRIVRERKYEPVYNGLSNKPEEIKNYIEGLII